MAFFNYDSKKVFYQITGKGIPLLLLHGNTASSKMFDSVIEMYAKYFQVITIDFPGHGRSDRVEKFNTDFWYYNAEVVNALLDDLHPGKVFIVGTSGGALVAINLALEHPDKVKFLFADSFEGEFPLSSYIDSLKNDRQQGKNDPDTKSFWEYCHGNNWEDIVDLDTEMLLEFSSTEKSFYHKSIAELKIPTLITGSRKDEFCDYLGDIYAAMKAKNPSLSVHLFEEGGHPAMLSNYMLFYEIVKEKALTLQTP
jgi:pimeloyl-ACP methyl ester carboxylesterase